MTVIAMSMEPGSLNRRFAADLARSLGLKLVDLRAFERDMAERSDCGDGIVRRFVEGRSPLTPSWSITSAQLALRLREAMLETAARGNVLVLGWSAVPILHPVHHIACVGVRAAMPVRERNVMRRLAFQDASLARMEIESIDALIGRFVRRLFDADWLDPDHCQLVLDAGRLPAHWCAGLVRLMLMSPRYEATPEAEAELDARLSALHRHELEHVASEP